MESTQNSDDIASYVPQVKADLIPMKNQEFQTLRDVETYYKNYAKAAGFDIKHFVSKKKDGVFIRKEYICSKEGTSKVTGQKRNHKQTREQCKARLAVVRRPKIGKYVVTIFVEGHSHPLTSPRRHHLTKIHRELSVAQKSLLNQLTEVNVPTCTQYDFLGVNSGGIENISFLQQDICNYKRGCRKEVKGHDGDLLHEYFLNEKEKDPSFIFKIEVDNEKRINRVFWADAICRQSYKFFGDVVIFDTTYNTNKYSMIFAPLVGVNNHGQTIILACAFLSNETTDSFKWFFNEFLKAMPGDAPRMIITDQDPAMTKAISEVLPQTFHRYCSWHILNKFSEKIDPAKYTRYYDEFQDCIWNSENRDEFDAKWTTIVESSGLNDNECLQTMYEIRSTWVPVYVNHIFSAGMSSSQRAESGHAFYKRFVSVENILVNFMVHFNRAVTHQRQMQLIEDYVDINKKPNFDSPFEMADQMARVYTHECFKEFMSSWRNVVVIDLSYHIKAICVSCKKFETTGIPCRHILAFLIFILQVDKLPDQYILKRWTKSRKSEVVIDDVGEKITDNKDLLTRRSHLCHYVVEVIDKIVGSEEASAMFLDLLETVLKKYNSMLANGETINSEIIPVESKSLPSHHIYNEPVQVRAKGCWKRLKAGKEKGRLKAAKKANGKGRFCHGCKKYDQQHDKRNCPSLKNKKGVLINETGDEQEDQSDPNTSGEEYSSTEVYHSE